MAAPRRTPEVMVGTKGQITPKQSRFVEEYLVDLNASRAAREAGYGRSPNSAMRYAVDLLKIPHVQAAIAAAQEARGKRTGITSDRILLEIAKLAFCDLTSAMGEDGELKPISEWPEELRAAVSGLDVTELTSEGASVGLLKKLRTASKLGALELLGRSQGLFVDRVKHEGLESQAERLRRSRERSRERRTGH